MPVEWRSHFSRNELFDEIEQFSFPDKFLFGTSTSGYQSEGGFNGPDDPKNNWYYVERDGTMEPTGPGSRFWELYSEDLETAALMGCNGFRMGIEWSRVQPDEDPESRKPPPFDSSALDRYADIIARCKKLGMEPLVTLFHFTHPLWLGLDPWLEGEKMTDLFVRYVEHTVREINKRLVQTHKTSPIAYFITLNEPAMVPLACYFLKIFPRGKGKGGGKDFATSFENILLAHVAAFEKIQRIYVEKEWERPTVTVNGWTSAAYPMDFLVLDVLHAACKGIDAGRFRGYLKERKKVFEKQMELSPCRKRQNWRQRGMEKVIIRIMEYGLGKKPFARLAQRVLSEPTFAPWMDVLAFDFYGPYLGDYLETNSLFHYKVRKDPWEWGIAPEGLGEFLDAYASLAGPMPLHIVENGMSYAFRNGKGEERRDGADRVEVMKAHLFECIRARNRGTLLEAYFYWTLFDNYEWGSFTPCFGMLAVDYQNGAKRSPLDVVGNNAAGAYQAIVKAFRAKDKDALRDAFCADQYPLLFPK